MSEPPHSLSQAKRFEAMGATADEVARLRAALQAIEDTANPQRLAQFAKHPVGTIDAIYTMAVDALAGGK